MNRTDVLIAVVLYGESLYECNTYRTLVAENPDVALFVYDNSPVAMHPEGVGRHGTQYVSDPLNRGLSYAYNRAAEYAQSNGFGWLLIADQDTHFCQGLLDAYIEQINLHPDQVLFVPLMAVSEALYMSPVRKRFCGNQLESSVPRGEVRLSRYAPINSGMMVSIEAFWRVGGYNERVPLDFSDFQFVDRLAAHYASFYVLDRVCRQEFSNQVQNKEQKLKRFALFCRCLNNYEKQGVKSKLSVCCIALKRMLSLVASCRSVIPITLFFKHYMPRIKIEAAPMSSQGVVLIDVCGTIFRSNTTFDFLDFYVPKPSYKLFRRLMCSIVWRTINKVLYLVFGIDLTRLIALRYIQGKSYEELLVAAGQFYDAVLQRRIQRPVTALIEQYRQEGCRLVLASATVDFIAQTVAKRLGVDTFISTRLVYRNGVCSGHILRDALGRKSDILLQNNIAPPYVATITDNTSDTDILAFSEKCFVVVSDKDTTQWDKRLPHHNIKNVHYVHV